MKILKVLFGIILFLALLLLGKILLTPSISYDCEITVDKPANEAWAVMSDETKLPEWINGFKKTELISGKANTVGAVSKIYVDENGQEMVMEETIKAIKPGEHLAMTFTMDFMNMDYIINMDEKDGKTFITSKSTTMGNSFFAKSLITFMPSAMKAQEQENLNKLKKLIEENTKNYFPQPEIAPQEATTN